MNNLLYGLLVVILALNLFALGNRSILNVIRIIAFQGILLGVLPLIMHEQLTFSQVFASLAAISLKGVIIPAIMTRALRDAKIKREVEPLVGFLPSIILGALVTGMTFLLFNQILSESDGHERMIIPASVTTVLVGFILLVTRYKAITQVMGYLVLENGIYIFSLLLVVAIPLVVEMGMLLDLFVSVFIISIITNHINQAFSSLDTRRLTTLKE
jgi:hydrogenase-4 component E